MDLTLTRTAFRPDGIFGVLTDEVGQIIAHTLEHAYDDAGDGTWLPKIPGGEFTCVRGEHQLASGPIETFEITDVPSHTGLLFHCGNFDRDSEGCVLLGYAETEEGGQRVVTASRAAFARFMQLEAGLDVFQLTVK